jgi:hypothetical protein
LLKRETVDFLYLEFLASPSIPLKTTLDCFQMSMRHLIEDMIGLLVQLEPIIFVALLTHECPIDFDTNVLQSEIARKASLQRAHSALRKILAYIDDSELSESFAAEWFALLKAQFAHPAAHSALPCHPAAVVRSFARITSPFRFSRRGVSGWLILGRCFENPLVYVDSTRFSIAFEDKEGSFCAIPIDDTLDGTFFTLVLSFKYFVYFVASRPWPSVASYRQGVYTFFIDSLNANSPFFSQFHVPVLAFLRSRMPLGSSDLTAPFIESLNLLAVYSRERPTIQEFLEEQELLFEERSLMVMRASFPAFLTPQDVQFAASLAPGPWDLPRAWLVPMRCDSELIRPCVSNIKRLFTPRDSLVGFPFHLLLRSWVDAMHAAPPFSRRSRRGAHVVEIEFAPYRPATARLLIMNADVHATLAGAPVNGAFAVPDGPFALELPPGETWSALQWTLLGDAPAPHVGRDFLLERMDRFTADITAWLTVLTADIDQEILRQLGTADLERPEFSPAVDPARLLRGSLSGLPLHVLLMRAPPLLMLNWMAVSNVLDVSTDPSLGFLLPHISAASQVHAFLSAVERHSGQQSSDMHVHIDRAAAFNVRSRSSASLRDTVMSQMAQQCRNPAALRQSGRPWSVTFVGEHGVDAGGPARELVGECAADLCAPNCGLVVPVPNARNDVGECREWVVPLPSPRHSNSEAQYKFAGALIAIAVRTGIVQDFVFSPLVWEYLAQQRLAIDRLFEIDQNYKLLIQALQEALRSEIGEAEFAARFRLVFTEEG